jgi:hypothetical protein
VGTDVTLTLPDLLAGVRAHATPGHRASGAWLRAVPEGHLYALLHAETISGTAGHPMQESAADTVVRVMLALLKAERGREVPQIASVEDATRDASSICAAAKIELLRRQGAVTVEPPLPSIFHPGASVVRWITPEVPE